MNKENLFNMADYLDGGLENFDMKVLCNCVIGHAVRHFGHLNRQGLVKVSDYTCGEAMTEIFGIKPQTEAAAFCFGGHWGHKTGGKNSHAAAQRLRYVAIHGDAPDRDQWERFENPSYSVPVRFVETKKYQEALPA
jgi:hypothetical protein